MGSSKNIIRIEERNKTCRIDIVRTKKEKLVERIDTITKSLSRKYFNNILRVLADKNAENVEIICDYIIVEQTEINIKDSTKEGKIKVLVWLSNFFEDKLSFREMTKQDILRYLNSLRKSNSDDLSQRWIGSYNGRQIIFNKFFRWLYNPDEPNSKNRETPNCMKGIKKLPRKDKTPYKPSDIWEPREHAVFLKYCPSKRDRCYHALANDMSARPHEILNLKIKDIVFKKTDDGKQYAEVRIISGKTGSRTIPLIDSLPYVKDWLHEHPSGTNPDSWLFVSLGNNHGFKFTYEGLSSHYEYYKKKFFPELLRNDTFPETDKAIIKNMLTKPWNLYVLRHSALTEKSQILKEHVLRDHAGWSMSSQMPEIYIHYFGNESSKSLLEAKGIIKKEDQEQTIVLKSKQCPNCNEPNKPDSKFCSKCNMILSYNSYQETIEGDKNKETEIMKIKEEIDFLKKSQNEILELLKYPKKLGEFLKIEQ
ncbi:MAG: hypothetical protein ACPKPY_02860 [Nitrososphaeraceae archaeon]